MSGHRPWSEIKRKLPRDPERERRRDEMRRAYDAVRPFVELAEQAGERGVTTAEIARLLGVADTSDAGALLDGLARHAETLGARLELRLVFPDEPADEVVYLRVASNADGSG